MADASLASRPSMSRLLYTAQEYLYYHIFFSSRRRHTRYWRDWSSDVCSSDLVRDREHDPRRRRARRPEPRLAGRPAHRALRRSDRGHLGTDRVLLPDPARLFTERRYEHGGGGPDRRGELVPAGTEHHRSEEHTSELQSRQYLVCRL